MTRARRPAKPATLTTESAAAKACGCGVSTLRRWRDEGAPHERAPGKRGQVSYDLDRLREWLAARGRTGRRGRARRDGMVPGGVAETSAEELDGDGIKREHALAELRRVRAIADKHELQNEEKRRRVVRVDEIRELLDLVASGYRGFGERLQRAPSVAEGARLLEECIEENEAAVRRWAEAMARKGAKG